MEIKVYPIDAKKVIEVTELCEKYKKLSKNLTVSFISETLEISESYARNAIGAMKQLKLNEISDKIANSCPKEQKQLFRKALQSYEPFLEFISFLSKGNTPQQAIRKVIGLYDIKRNAKDVLWTFQNWGIFAGIFKNKNFELVKEIKSLKPSKIIELEYLNNELKVKIWIKSILTDSENWLSNEEFDSLVKSVINVWENPRESIKVAGEVLEDTLRKIAKSRKIDVRKKNGISEIAEELRKNKIIASKHVGVLKGLQVFLDRDIFDNFSSFRNMAHHSIDKYEMKRWELSEELALSYVIQVILCIKSLYYYVVKHQLKF
ncbi:MAG: AAA-associated domain-containing protein [Candidatus Aenigmarchaeota archaeon]|nr:AAA-associated domain-containing protein [Candidatus Aenigmarchaeota archaeon]